MSTFATLRTSGVVAAVGVLAMIAALLFAGQALRLGWPATPLRGGADSPSATAPEAFTLSPSASATGRSAGPDQRRAGEHPRVERERRRARRRAGDGRPETIATPAPRGAAPVAPAPAAPVGGSWPDEGRVDIGEPVDRDSDENGTVVTNPEPDADAERSPGWVPVPAPRSQPPLEP